MMKKLTKRYQFKGHLGDQDYFTIVGWADRTVFYELGCEWNRQLCEYWREKYGETWEAFHECKKPVKIFHGNCGTDIEKYENLHDEL